MLYIITFTILFSFSLTVSVPTAIDTCPIDYTGLNDCSQYTAPATNANLCCMDNNNNYVEYSNRCIAECNNNDQIYNCGECCQINDECPGSTCMTDGNPGTVGYCYGIHHECGNYQPPCDAANECLYKGNDLTCVENSYITGPSGTPQTTATQICHQCVCNDCGFGMYSKTCPTSTDSCQKNNPSSYDTCGTCRSGIIDTCPASSGYDCGSYTFDTTTPVCCYQEAAPAGIVKYSSMCIAECSGENLSYCGACCNDNYVCTGEKSCFNPNNDAMGACTVPNDKDCFAQLGYNKASCDYTNPDSCLYRGESGVSCVEKTITITGSTVSTLVCGECQEDPTTTSSPVITTTSAGATTTSGTITTSAGATTTSASATTTSADTITTTSGTTDSGATTTDSRTTDSGTTEVSGTPETCTIWGQNPFDIIENVCEWCFKNRGRQKVCYKFIERVGSSPTTNSWFNFDDWLILEQAQCFLDYCSLDCDVDQVEIKDGKTLPADCGCDAFQCKCECVNGDNSECTGAKKRCKTNANGCNECVECMDQNDCPGAQCNSNNECDNGNNPGKANKIGVMVGMAFVISVFGLM